MILQALDRYYDRMAARGEAPPAGYVAQSVYGQIVLSNTGQLLAVTPIGSDGRGRTVVVPEPVTEPSARTATAVVPYFLADNPSYLLGSKPGDRRVQTKFEKSAEFHNQLLNGVQDPCLRAVMAFFARYKAEADRCWSIQNYNALYVMRLDGDLVWAHQKTEAEERWSSYLDSVRGDEGACLVSGKQGFIVRLHPKLGGFKDADTLVGFDKPAFRSFGQEQGGNAPTSNVAAHRYGAALNWMLAFGGRNRLPRGIGDATVVFWADASGAEQEPAAAATESVFCQALAPSDDGDAGQAVKLRDSLVALAEGRPREVDPGLKPGVRFNVLGLSPNAARLSVRFWLSDSFEAFARAMLRHMDDIAIEPAPRGWSGKKGTPDTWRLLFQVCLPDALKKKGGKPAFEFSAKHCSQVGSDLICSVLTEAPYPRTWLTAAVVRLRAGDDPWTGWHAAAIKACINRNNRIGRDSAGPFKEDLPVALTKDHPSNAYQLGRLFAVIEAAQYAALGRVNATVADRYYAAASSTPARVFASLLRNAHNHVSDAKKRGGGIWIEKKLEEIIGRLSPDLPPTLMLEDQGRFAVGYYHERASRPVKSEPATNQTDADAELAAAEQEERE